MSKANFKKNPKKEKGIIPLENGWALIAPIGVGDSTDLLVAIGALVSLYAAGGKENNLEKQKLKTMMAAYIDSIYDGKLPEGLFVKKENKKDGGTNNGAK